MSMVTKIIFSGSDCSFFREDFPDNIWGMLMDCAIPGDATPFVKDFISSPDIEIEVSESDAREYLRGYGAWSDENLRDHDANIERLVWILATNFRESLNEPCTCGCDPCKCVIEAHLSTY